MCACELSWSQMLCLKAELLQVGRVCVKLPRATNNVAEYTALIHGMEVRLLIMLQISNGEG